MINTYKWTIVELTSDQWHMLYNDETNEILIEPRQSSGSYTCADTLLVADTREELDAFIKDNNLVPSRSIRKRLIPEYETDDN